MDDLIAPEAKLRIRNLLAKIISNWEIAQCDSADAEIDLIALTDLCIAEAAQADKAAIRAEGITSALGAAADHAVGEAEKLLDGMVGDATMGARLFMRALADEIRNLALIDAPAAQPGEGGA